MEQGFATFKERIPSCVGATNRKLVVLNVQVVLQVFIIINTILCNYGSLSRQRLLYLFFQNVFDILALKLQIF